MVQSLLNPANVKQKARDLTSDSRQVIHTSENSAVMSPFTQQSIQTYKINTLPPSLSNVPSRLTSSSGSLDSSQQHTPVGLNQPDMSQLYSQSQLNGIRQPVNHTSSSSTSSTSSTMIYERGSNQSGWANVLQKSFENGAASAAVQALKKLSK